MLRILDSHMHGKIMHDVVVNFFEEYILFLMKIL